MLAKPGVSWPEVYSRAQSAAPEAFDGDRINNLIDGKWQDVGESRVAVSPVDGTRIPGPSRVSLDTAFESLAFVAEEHAQWSRSTLDERKERVSAALDELTERRDTIAELLLWEIGKPWRLACVDVDRCLEGVRWYVEEIGGMLEGRGPLSAPVSNIASWNYPMSVLVHSELVQLLAGNAVIAKTPSQGGAICLTVAHAVMRRAGLPVTLVAGTGTELSDALVRAKEVGALAFVGGRSNGGKVAAQLVDTGKRHFLEQEGLNAWGVWEFSQWDVLAKHLKKGFEYGKQRCTAYPRYVVQRSLFDDFLAMYLEVARSVSFGNPLAVEDPDDPLPDLDFGPVISAAKADELRSLLEEAVDGGGIPLYRGELADGRFVDGQDTAAYVAPACVLAPPGSHDLMHAEPFGPIDTIVIVDTASEMLAAMNASNGSLVASLACDDEDLATELSEQLQAFKVGINKPRSRGDKAEVFGGRGASWRGAFVGGELLVRAVTEGPPDERLYGNFPDYSLYPPT